MPPRKKPRLNTSALSIGAGENTAISSAVSASASVSASSPPATATETANSPAALHTPIASAGTSAAPSHHEPSTIDPWTTAQTTSLFKAVIRYKPTGMHKHFHMVSIANYMWSHGHGYSSQGANASGESHARMPGIWRKLGELYDLAALDEREEVYARRLLVQQLHEYAEDEMMVDTEAKDENGQLDVSAPEYAAQQWVKEFALPEMEDDGFRTRMFAKRLPYGPRKRRANASAERGRLARQVDGGADAKDLDGAVDDDNLDQGSGASSPPEIPWQLDMSPPWASSGDEATGGRERRRGTRAGRPSLAEQRRRNSLAKLERPVSSSTVGSTAGRGSRGGGRRRGRKRVSASAESDRAPGDGAKDGDDDDTGDEKDEQHEVKDSGDEEEQDEAGEDEDDEGDDGDENDDEEEDDDGTGSDEENEQEQEEEADAPPKTTRSSTRSSAIASTKNLGRRGGRGGRRASSTLSSRKGVGGRGAAANASSSFAKGAGRPKRRP